MTERAILPESFFLPSAEIVAPRLLGHWLIRNTVDGPCGGPIVEVEAYLANDPACHAYRGQTARNRTMWGPPGRAYVYFIYGCHFCVNAVCGERGNAEAVLIRAIEPAVGEEFMRRNRAVKTRLELTNGPAKLCSAMHIDRRLDGANLCDGESTLYIAPNPNGQEFTDTHGPILASQRIGISKAADMRLRFYLAASPFVSRHPRQSSRLC